TPHLSVSATPRSLPTSTLFPYTTLFRSKDGDGKLNEDERKSAREAREKEGPRGEARRGDRRPGEGRGPEARRGGEGRRGGPRDRSEEHTSELQSRENLVCRLVLEKNNEQ